MDNGAERRQITALAGTGPPPFAAAPCCFTGPRSRRFRRRRFFAARRQIRSRRAKFNGFASARRSEFPPGRGDRANDWGRKLGQRNDGRTDPQRLSVYRHRGRGRRRRRRRRVAADQPDEPRRLDACSGLDRSRYRRDSRRPDRHDQMARQAGLHQPPHGQGNQGGGRRQRRHACRTRRPIRPACRSRNG